MGLFLNPLNLSRTVPDNYFPDGDPQQGRSNLRSNNSHLQTPLSTSDWPDWLNVTNFYAESSTEENVNRIMNDMIAGFSIYGCYALATGGSDLVAYAAYLSMGYMARKIASTGIGYLVYPAAFTSLPCFDRTGLEEERDKQIKELTNKGFIVRKIVLYKSGIGYSAAVVTHPDTMNNGKWFIDALGNRRALESIIAQVAKNNFKLGCNTLLVNGPAVCQSGGLPTPYQMGAPYEAGIRYLEKVISVSHVIMRGFSLGGIMMRSAIDQHDFKPGLLKRIYYLSITDRSFSRLTKVAGNIHGPRVENIFHLTGTELDGVPSAEKLENLKIRQIVIQHVSEQGNGTDGEINDRVSLAFALKGLSLTNVKFLESSEIKHNEPLPRDIEDELNVQIQAFLTLGSE